MQSTEIPGTLSVYEHVELFSSYYPNALPIEETLEIADLVELQHKKFDTLSGGQKQRVFFAFATCGTVLNRPLISMVKYKDMSPSNNQRMKLGTYRVALRQCFWRTLTSRLFLAQKTILLYHHFELHLTLPHAATIPSNVTSTLALKNQIFPYADNPYILPEDGLVAD